MLHSIDRNRETYYRIAQAAPSCRTTTVGSLSIMMSRLNGSRPHTLTGHSLLITTGFAGAIAVGLHAKEIAKVFGHRIGPKRTLVKIQSDVMSSSDQLQADRADCLRKLNIGLRKRFFKKGRPREESIDLCRKWLNKRNKELTSRGNRQFGGSKPIGRITSGDPLNIVTVVDLLDTTSYDR